MEITIRTTCPKCSEEIEIYSRTSSEAIRREHEEVRKMFFDCAKGATERAVSIGPGPFFKDILKIIDEYMPRGRNAVNYVKNHFDELEAKIRISDNPKELLKLSNDLAKTKVKVSKPILKEVQERKKKVLELLKRRVNEIKNAMPKGKRKR